MCIEIGLESTRNPRVGEIFRSVDRFVHESFLTLFQRLKDEGRIDPVLDIPALANVFVTIGDGLFWRRATDPNFDAKLVLPAVISVFGSQLRPTGIAPTAPAKGPAQSHEVAE